MSTDVKLDQGDGRFLNLEAQFVKAVASDFMLDIPNRRKTATPSRRALVHDFNDGLTLNWDGDYPGGITLIGVSQIIPLTVPKDPPVPNPVLVVRGAISYEIDLPVDPLQGGAPGDTHTQTVNINDLFDSLIDLIKNLTARVAALEAK